MEYSAEGKLMRGVGGLYAVRLDTGDHPLSGAEVFCRARGVLRHRGETPLVGDRVRVVYTDDSYTAENGTPVPRENGNETALEEILPRRNEWIRPAMANLDLLFVAVASATPAPVTETVDKLTAIAEYCRAECVIVITKNELDPVTAETLEGIYRLAGFPVFSLSSKQNVGVGELAAYVDEHLAGKTAAFAGASGVGKSTLLNALFPDLSLSTGEVSRKTERGKHTTRQVELHSIGTSHGEGYLADTPGFSLLDFLHFDFFPKEELPGTMRDFLPYLGSCRYTSCTHTKEQDCAVVQAVVRGEISKSRHEGFLAMYREMKDKKSWETKSGGKST